MKFPIGCWLKKFSAIAFLILAGCVAAAALDKPVSRTSVTFAEPENSLTRRAELAPTSDGVLQELEKFLFDLGTRYVPEA